MMQNPPRNSLSASAFLVALCVLGASRVLAQAPAADAPPPPADQSAGPATADLSPYQKAVRDYVDAAGKELEAYRLKIEDGLKKKPKNETYAAAKAKQADGVALLAKLKEADQSQFDARKATFEQSLSELIALVKQAETS